MLGAVAALLYAADVPVKLSLEDAASRLDGTFMPVYQGKLVTIGGIVNHAAYHFPEYTLLAVQDGHGAAAILKVGTDETRLDAFLPGEQIEVTGRVAFLTGTIVIEPDTIVVLGRKPPPHPLEVDPTQAQDLKYLGMLVHVHGPLRQVADTSSGAEVFLDGKLKIFLPRTQEETPPNFATFAAGDNIEVTGIVHQYTIRKPYNRGFELLVQPRDLIHHERGWTLPPLVLGAAIAVVVIIALLIWNRERRLRDQRERLRKTYQLGEEILGAPSRSDIVKRIAEALPGILGITRVHLFVHNRGARTLDEVIPDSAAAVSIPLGSPPAGTRAGAAACFHYRTLLAIPDISRSPFPIAGKEGEKTPHSLLFVPMTAQGEVVGVLELDQDDQARDFTSDEQTLAQHLGNQIAVAIRLLDQRSVQEQLFRTEKLAAIGRLISGVVNELKTPLASISSLAQRALDRSTAEGAARELSTIAAEAHKAAGMVARLVSFAAAEQVEARPISISALLRSLIEFREGDWKASGIRVRDLTSTEPLLVLGSQGQLEQLFLNLLVHAEQSLADAPQKLITVRTSVLARRLLVEIAFTAPAGRPEETAAVLGVTRSVIAGHNGEVRFIEKSNAEPRFEVELPVTTAKERVAFAQPSSGSGERAGHRMTGLLIEPDEAAQRQLTVLLAARGYRVVPIPNADNALELAHRMRFDAAFCSVHAPGLNWVELSERMQPRVGAFVLLSDGYDAELSADFEGDGRFVLPKPVQEQDLDRVLRSAERLGTAKVIPIVKNDVA